MIKNFLRTSIGILFILYIIYVRLIRVRLPRDLIFYNPIKISLILIIIIAVIIHSLIIIFCIKRLLNKEINVNGYFYKKGLIIREFQEDCLGRVYLYIGNKFEDPFELITNIADKFYLLVKDINESLLILLNYSIRLLVVIIFFIDIFIFFKLNYFYVCLVLLIIPLIIKIFIYILENVALGLTTYEEALIIEYVDTNPITGVPKYRYTFIEGYENKDLDDTVKKFIICSRISGYLEEYHKYRSLLTPYFGLLISSLYIIGWTYIVIINIILYFSNNEIL